MRFKYNPEEYELSIYVNKDEFQLAAGEKEYRVCLRQFENEADVQKFIHEMVKFFKQIVGSIYSDEKIRDIVAITTLDRMGFAFTSLLDVKKHYSSFNFLETLLAYGVNEMRLAHKKKGEEAPTSIMDALSSEDIAKLTLARVLLNSINHPALWRQRPKQEKLKGKTELQLKKLKGKIKSYETKFGFSSEEMYKFYNDDEMPDDDMKTWKEIYQQYKIAQMSLDKYNIAEDLVKKWQESFE